MWKLALLTAVTLAPAQAGEPDFKNARFTYGLLGQTRTGDKFLPGDVVCLAFDAEGLTVKEDGQVLYAMGFEITKKGEKKPVQKRVPQDYEVVNNLGTGSFPAVATYPIPRDEQAPGEYEITITLTDRTTKKSKTLTKKFEVSAVKLGFILVRYTSTALVPEGERLVPAPAPPVGVVGQSVALHYSLVGFELDKKDKHTNVTLTIRVLDAKGNPVLKKPITNDIKSDAKAAPGVMIFQPYLINLNRTGKFTVELAAKCNVSGKDVKETLDLTVLEAK